MVTVTDQLTKLAASVTALTAVITFVVLGYLYWQDFRYVVQNFAIRNISYNIKHYCAADDSDERRFFRNQLHLEFDRYQRYAGQPDHRDGMGRQELCNGDQH